MITKMPARLVRGLSVFALLCMALVTIGYAQSDNTQINGFVKDQQGGVVTGAKVSVKNESNGLERTATTNGEGYYVVTQLPSGLYTVSVEANGFKLYKETGKKLDPNVPAKLDVALQPGQVSEIVNITATAVGVQTESAALSKLVDEQTIKNTLINGRNPLFLAATKPGVLGSNLGGNSFGLTQAGLIINGARTQDTLITFDGAVGVRTRSNGTSIGAADLDSTQEVQILTANYNAEYGRSAGGQVRIITKGGGRDFHGVAYEYLRNAALNTNSWGNNRTYNAARPCSDEAFKKDTACRPNPFRYNQPGFNLNGPVIIPGTDFNKDRNKLFWLYSMEWVRVRQTGNNTQRVPTARMRQGDFSELFPGGPNYIAALAQTRFVKDPLKTGACNATDQTACFNDGGIINKIPANRVSKNGLALLNAFPDPVPGFFSGGSNFFQSRPLLTNQRKENVNIDWLPSEKHQIKGRLALYHFVDVSAFRGATDRAPQIIDRPNQTVSIGWTWTLSPTWISETLVAGSRDQVHIAVDQRGDRYKRSNYGINYPYIFSSPKEIQDKIPTVDGLDIFGSLDGGPYPSSSTGPIYQFNNNWTNIRGNHTLKFGGYFERAGQNDFDQINVSGTPGGTNNQNGRFVFSNSSSDGKTGVAAANAALGLFDTYAEIGNRSYTPYRGHMFEWFVQDSWKATSKLRLEAGLRHSIIQPYYSLWRNMVVFDEKYYDPAKAPTIDPVTGFITSSATNLQSLYNGLVIPGSGWPDSAKGDGRVAIANTGQFDFLFRGEGKSFSQIHKNNFQPRVGIAYALNDKNVFRAGAGRFMTRLGVSDSVFLGGNPPLQPTVSVTNGSVDNPGGKPGNVFTQQITTQDKVFKNPEAWTWNGTFEREIGFGTKLEISYVGRRALHQQRERNLNQLQVGTCPAGVGCPFISGNSGARYNPDALRPYKGFNIIRLTNNDANALYNSFQVGLERRLTKGLSYSFAYTLSKSSDDGSAQRDVVPNAFDVSNLWGPSTYDRRHQVVLTFAYQLPFFKDQSKFMGKALGGWVISGVSQMATGNPITIATGDDFAGVGPGSGAQLWLFTQAPTIRAQYANNTPAATGTFDANYWFYPFNADGSAIFTKPAAGTISKQEARGLFYGPGFQNHNLRISKEFRFKESHSIQILGEAFNWLNHPNWNGPDTNPNNLTTTFGKITSKSSERQIQLALRYSF